MPETNMQTVPRIGCDNLHIAKLLTDTTSGATYDTPVHFIKVKSIGFSPNSSISTFFSDDGPSDVSASVGEEKVSIERADLLPEEYAMLTGADYTKGLVSVGDPNPPYVAALWRSKKSSGKYRYCRLLKVLFSVPQQTWKTKEQTPEFQTQSIEGNNALRIYDHYGFQFIDEDDPSLDTTVTPAVLAEQWFADVMFDPRVAYVAK